MKASKGMYSFENDKAIPIKADEIEWLLRYGNEEEILKHRLYIAHIVNLYINQQKEIELLNADKELLQSKWEAQGLMIQKLHEENGRYGEAVKLALMTLENNNLMNDEYKRIHAILDGNGNLDTPEFLK